jgi:hypothetical protein
MGSYKLFALAGFKHDPPDLYSSGSYGCRCKATSADSDLLLNTLKNYLPLVVCFGFLVFLMVKSPSELPDSFYED